MASETGSKLVNPGAAAAALLAPMAPFPMSMPPHRGPPGPCMTAPAPLHSYADPGKGGSGRAANSDRRVWTREEDDGIRALVAKYGTRSWSVIAEQMVVEYGIHGRSGKQCRERWHNHLDPCINKNAWTEEEERIMAEAHRELGNKWSLIAQRLPGRTDNHVKNHWYSFMRRNVRRLNREVAEVVGSMASTSYSSSSPVQSAASAADDNATVTSVGSTSSRGSTHAPHHNNLGSPKPEGRRERSSSGRKARSRKAANLAELQRYFTAAAEAAAEVLQETGGRNLQDVSDLQKLAEAGIKPLDNASRLVALNLASGNELFREKLRRKLEASGGVDYRTPETPSQPKTTRRTFTSPRVSHASHPPPPPPPPIPPPPLMHPSAYCDPHRYLPPPPMTHSMPRAPPTGAGTLERPPSPRGRLLPPPPPPAACAAMPPMEPMIMDAKHSGRIDAGLHGGPLLPPPSAHNMHNMAMALASVANRPCGPPSNEPFIIDAKAMPSMDPTACLFTGMPDSATFLAAQSMMQPDPSLLLTANALAQALSSLATQEAPPRQHCEPGVSTRKRKKKGTPDGADDALDGGDGFTNAGEHKDDWPRKKINAGENGSRRRGTPKGPGGKPSVSPAAMSDGTHNNPAMERPVGLLDSFPLLDNFGSNPFLLPFAESFHPRPPSALCNDPLDLDFEEIISNGFWLSPTSSGRAGFTLGSLPGLRTPASAAAAAAAVAAAAVAAGGASSASPSPAFHTLPGFLGMQPQPTPGANDRASSAGPMDQPFLPPMLNHPHDFYGTTPHLTGGPIFRFP